MKRREFIAAVTAGPATAGRVVLLRLLGLGQRQQLTTASNLANLPAPRREGQ